MGASSGQATSGGRQLVFLLAWGLVAGTAVGCALAADEVLANRYSESGLWRLAAATARAEIGRAVAVAVAAALALGLAVAIGERILAARTGSTTAAWRTDRAAVRAAVTLVVLVLAAVALALARFDELKRLVYSRGLGPVVWGWPVGVKLALLAAIGGLIGLPAAWLFVRVLAGCLRSARLRRVLLARAVLVIGALTVVALAALEGAHRVSGRAPARGPNVVLISIDTLRADHLGCYGSERPTSPHIDRLAAGGVRYEHALSQAPWTLPSMATLQTALYPSQHGAVTGSRRMARELDTLAEVLADAGYSTLAVVSHRFVGKDYGFAQGFGSFRDRIVAGRRDVTSELLTAEALERLSEGLDEPFFLWVHYFDPHFLYVRHPEFDFAAGLPSELADELIVRTLSFWPVEGAAEEQDAAPLSDEDIRYVEAVYDEEIAYTDRSIGQLLDGIDALGPERGVVVVLTADHGEYFMERGRFGHGRDVYGELVHVPLIIGGAIDESRRGSVVRSTVEVASIPRTVAQLAGVEQNPFRGADLLADEATELSARFSFTEGSDVQGASDRRVGVVGADWKLIRNLENGAQELYHLGTDAGEKTDLAALTDPEVAGILEQLEGALEGFGERLGPVAPEVHLTEEDREALRALGYTQ